MKKRKTYEISVIDRTYSKTISDETKFYTSDTALELVFKLKETEYTFESAEIVLLNENDKSLITRRVVKSDEGFVYEFEKEIIAHYGEWKAQLMLIENGDAHVSSPIKFRIENDLYSTKPQALSDVVSWVNLKLYAEKLVGEFKQAVDEAFAKNVEIENTFKANEQNRQTAFENAEQSRKTTFNASESERDETFNTNESARQTQELEREKAESQRQSVFDDNEASRIETFNTNEATRQENETARQQAETQRVSTESSRASAEEQRKTDHANRSAELAGKADKFALNNLFENGDFSNGAGKINLTEGAIIENQKLVLTHGTSGSALRWFTKRLNTDMYYVHIKYNTNETSGAYKLSNNQGRIYSLNSGSNFHSHRENYRYYANISIYGSRDATNDLVVDFYISLNLTEIFGEGNEPSKEEMDELIKVTGYINNEYALNNKEMMIWTLALIRRNKNAVITLGGTI